MYSFKLIKLDDFNQQHKEYIFYMSSPFYSLIQKFHFSQRHVKLMNKFTKNKLKSTDIMVVLYVYINHLHICKIHVLAHSKNSKVFIIKFNAYRDKVKVSVENLLSIFANS